LSQEGGATQRRHGRIIAHRDPDPGRVPSAGDDRAGCDDGAENAGAGR
jgi:hypothetical protein